MSDYTDADAQRLAWLISSHHYGTYTDTARRLLATGQVTVAAPPVPDVEPGTAGTATVDGRPGVRVMRTNGHAWCAIVSPDAYFVVDDDEVTDFVPDVMLTAEMVEDLLESMQERYGAWSKWVDAMVFSTARLAVVSWARDAGVDDDE